MMQEPIDRAAMIEAASRNLRQQMARNRPRSKGSLHDGAPPETCIADESRGGEHAQRRIRSAENQNRIISTAGRDAPRLSQMMAPTPSASAMDNYPLEDDADEEMPLAAAGHDDVQKLLPQEYAQDLKRPASRKKDPSASAAAGLGAYAGPTKMSDAFEQRKTRQPIPVESWGPRPPSRAGIPQKGGSPTLDAGLGDVDLKGSLRPSSRGSGASSSALGAALSLGSTAKVVGGTWAAARPEPRGTGDTRRGRGDRKTSTRGTHEATFGAADLGIFGSGASNQQLTKSLSEVFDHHSSQIRESKTTPSRSPVYQPGNGASRPADFAGALEVSGYGLSDTSAAWPGSPGAAPSCSGSPPTRKGRHSGVDAVAVEDIEAVPSDYPIHGGAFRRDATPPQLIVTRSTQMNQSRGQVRRGTEQRLSRERDRDTNMPAFSTSLDVDFLKLFAS